MRQEADSWITINRYPLPKCPTCNIELDWVGAYEPWHDEYLMCPCCDGTYCTFAFDKDGIYL